MMHVKSFVNWKALCIYSTPPTHSLSSVRIESRITVPSVTSSTLGEMKLWIGKSGHPSEVGCEQNCLPTEPAGVRARQDGWRLYGALQLTKYIGICHLVASQPPCEAGSWTALSLLVKREKGVFREVNKLPKVT